LCFIFALSTLTGWQGYNFLQSDWSKISDIDYATNKTAANYYDGGVEWYRFGSFKYFVQYKENNVKYYVPVEINKKLKKGETVRIGVDYYAMMPISAELLPASVRRLDYWHGQVYVFTLEKHGKSIYWKLN